MDAKQQQSRLDWRKIETAFLKHLYQQRRSSAKRFRPVVPCLIVTFACLMMIKDKYVKD